MGGYQVVEEHVRRDGRFERVIIDGARRVVRRCCGSRRGAELVFVARDRFRLDERLLVFAARQPERQERQAHQADRESRSISRFHFNLRHDS